MHEIKKNKIGLFIVSLLLFFLMIGVGNHVMAGPLDQIPFPVEGAKKLKWETTQKGKITEDKPYACYQFTIKDYLECGFLLTSDTDMEMSLYDSNGVLVRKVSVNKYVPRSIWEDEDDDDYDYRDEQQSISEDSAPVVLPNYIKIEWDDIWPDLLCEIWKGKHYLFITPSEKNDGSTPKYGKFYINASKRIGKVEWIELPKSVVTYTGSDIDFSSAKFYKPDGTCLGLLKDMDEVKFCNMTKANVYSSYVKGTKVREIGRYVISASCYQKKPERDYYALTLLTVTPQNGQITSLESPKKGKIKIKTKLNPVYSGCEVETAMDADFTKNVKHYNMKKCKVLKRKTGQTYYVRLRYYKKLINRFYYAVGQEECIYGPWSSVKKVVCK